jgi:LL-diaminopimelate aminotransferase
MARINDHYLELKAGYLFPEIARRVNAFSDANAGAQIIKLGIGDVTEPLPAACIEAMHKAIDEMAQRSTFRGYGPEQGYPFLREKIAEHDFRGRGCEVDADEIFISDGSKCDTGNILDILGPGNKIAITDPVYPVYYDTNVMAGNRQNIVLLPISAENDFTPALPKQKVDIIYLCYPNNPTGAVANKQTLAQWVAYAKDNDALILFDAAYEAYITDASIPHSVYEIDGARDVAIEFRSFSKNAGFTGTRCAITVVPKSLKGKAADGSDVQLHKLWNRRHCTKFNGVSYIVQRGAEAVYSEAGRKQTSDLIAFYLENAKIIRENLTSLGLDVFGGVNAPYVWIQTPKGMTSWDFFDMLLSEAHVVGTPGSGFGEAGEGYFRISAFNRRDNVNEAMARMRDKVSV